MRICHLPGIRFARFNPRMSQTAVALLAEMPHIAHAESRQWEKLTLTKNAPLGCCSVRVLLAGRYFSSRTASRSPAAESHLSLSPKIERALRKSRAVHSSTPGLKRGRKLASVCRTSTPLRDRAGADDAQQSASAGCNLVQFRRTNVAYLFLTVSPVRFISEDDPRRKRNKFTASRRFTRRVAASRGGFRLRRRMPRPEIDRDATKAGFRGFQLKPPINGSHGSRILGFLRMNYRNSLRFRDKVPKCMRENISLSALSLRLYIYIYSLHRKFTVDFFRFFVLLVHRTFTQLHRQVIGTHAAWTTQGNAFLLDRGKTRFDKEARLARHESRLTVYPAPKTSSRIIDIFEENNALSLSLSLSLSLLGAPSPNNSAVS